MRAGLGQPYVGRALFFNQSISMGDFSGQADMRKLTLPAAAVVIGVTVLGALILYFVTEGLFMVAHQVP